MRKTELDDVIIFLHVWRPDIPSDLRSVLIIKRLCLLMMMMMMWREFDDTWSSR